MGMQMEDKHFQSLLNETQVLITRDHNKWNFDILMAVVCGPLLHPRRLEEALKASKFGRRLLSFFHPQNRRFSDIKKTKVGPAFLANLLSVVQLTSCSYHLSPLSQTCAGSASVAHSSPPSSPIRTESPFSLRTSSSLSFMIASPSSTM